MSTALVRFRRNLRLANHPAWSTACAEHAQVLSVYIQPDSQFRGQPVQPAASGCIIR